MRCLPQTCAIQYSSILVRIYWLPVMRKWWAIVSSNIYKCYTKNATLWNSKFECLQCLNRNKKNAYQTKKSVPGKSCARLSVLHNTFCVIHINHITLNSSTVALLGILRPVIRMAPLRTQPHCVYSGLHHRHSWSMGASQLYGRSIRGKVNLPWEQIFRNAWCVHN